LDQSGFLISAGYFNEPEVSIFLLSSISFPNTPRAFQELDMEGDRGVVREGVQDKKKKRGWFMRGKKTVQSTDIS